MSNKVSGIRRHLKFLPVLLFFVGAVITTTRAYLRVERYVEVEAEVIGQVNPGGKRGMPHRELYVFDLPDGRRVQAFGGVVGVSSKPGDTKRVLYDPTETYATTYEENAKGTPNTAPVYTTLISVILVPSVLWVCTIVLLLLVLYLSRIKPIHADAGREEPSPSTS